MQPPRKVMAQVTTNYHIYIFSSCSSEHTTCRAHVACRSSRRGERNRVERDAQRQAKTNLVPPCLSQSPHFFSIRVLDRIRKAIFIVATICNTLGAIEGKPAEADDLGPT